MMSWFMSLSELQMVVLILFVLAGIHAIIALIDGVEIILGLQSETYKSTE